MYHGEEDQCQSVDSLNQQKSMIENRELKTAQAKQRPKIEDLMLGMSEANSRLSRLFHRVDDMRDRVLGNVPKSDSCNKEETSSEGHLEQMDRQISLSHNNISAIEELMAELETAI